MGVSSLTTSKYGDIGENHGHWTHFLTNSKLFQSQTNLSMYLQWRIRLVIAIHRLLWTILKLNW